MPLGLGGAGAGGGAAGGGETIVVNVTNNSDGPTIPEVIDALEAKVLAGVTTAVQAVRSGGGGMVTPVPAGAGGGPY